MDDRDFMEKGKKPSPRADEVTKERRWWLLDGASAAQAVQSNLEILRRAQTVRLAQQVISARLYGNLPVLGLPGFSMDMLAASQAALRESIAYNVVQSCVDTAQAKMAKNKPRPFHLTSGGNYQQRRKAKRLNQLVDGIFHETQAHANGIEIFRDGCVWGDGWTRVYEDGHTQRIRHERVLPSELWLDEVEGFYGAPRQIHRVKDVDRLVLAAAWSKHKAEILKAPQANLDQKRRHDNIADVVTVRESWHLASGPKAGDGWRMVSIDGVVLERQPWTRETFPFARFTWCPRLWGFWGQGVPEQIQNIQLEVNKLLQVIQMSFHLGGAYKIFLKIGSKIIEESINNLIGGVVMYAGDTPPQYVVPPLVAPEIFQHLLTLKQSAYEQTGISTMTASSVKPEGLNSGKALREYDDIGADRFLTVGQRYQNYYMALARLDIETAREIAEREGDYKVKVPTRSVFREMSWKEVDLEEDSYVMQCFPVSSLPSDPAGRLQTVQEYAQAGYITPRQAKRLLDFPDMEQIDSLANAAEEYLTMVLDRIVDQGEMTQPEPTDDLQLALELQAEYYMDAKLHGLEETRLELLRIWGEQVKELIQLATPPPMAGPGGAPGMGPPGGVAAPPPVSDMISNAPQMAA